MDLEMYFVSLLNISMEIVFMYDNIYEFWYLYIYVSYIMDKEVMFFLFLKYSEL